MYFFGDCVIYFLCINVMFCFLYVSYFKRVFLGFVIVDIYEVRFMWFRDFEKNCCEVVGVL